MMLELVQYPAFTCPAHGRNGRTFIAGTNRMEVYRV
jgi:hypothetical protein